MSVPFLTETAINHLEDVPLLLETWRHGHRQRPTPQNETGGAETRNHGHNQNLKLMQSWHAAQKCARALPTVKGDREGNDGSRKVQCPKVMFSAGRRAAGPGQAKVRSRNKERGNGFRQLDLAHN